MRQKGGGVLQREKETIVLGQEKSQIEKETNGKRGKLSLQVHYWLMVLPGFVWIFLFSVVPMVGIIMAFEDFSPSRGWFGSEWVGLENFEYLWRLSDARRVLKNTLIIAGGKLFLNLVIPIVFAILLNEVVNLRFKKAVQTIVYLPHFISWVILANIMSNIFGYQGVVNAVLGMFGTEPVVFMGEPDIFRQLLIGTDVWKEFGYGAVIYLAALTSIDPNLYEAASIDGAGRWKLIRYITLPSLIPTVVLMGTLSLGSILNGGFDQVFNMYNASVYSTADIIDTWVYRIGLVNVQYSLASCAGLLKSVVSLVLISVSYLLAHKFADYRIF